MAQNYGSDADGNTTSDGKRAMAWDSQNRLIENYLSGGGTADQHVSRFKYGADGLRRRMITYTLPYYEDEGDILGVPSSGGRTEYKPANATITHYGYDGTNAVREWSEDPLTQVKTVAATYLLGPSGPMYKRPANAADVRWYVYDGLGSVVGEVDVNGVLMCQKKTDVYGISRGNVGTALSRHGFVGGLGHYSDDETGLVYMRARYYDPSIGRFISEDPTLHGKNWFCYCKNDPVNSCDASGNVEMQLSPALASLIELCYDASQISMPISSVELRAMSETVALAFLSEQIVQLGGEIIQGCYDTAVAEANKLKNIGKQDGEAQVSDLDGYVKGRATARKVALSAELSAISTYLCVEKDNARDGI